VLLSDLLLVDVSQSIV